MNLLLFFQRCHTLCDSFSWFQLNIRTQRKKLFERSRSKREKKTRLKKHSVGHEWTQQHEAFLSPCKNENYLDPEPLLRVKWEAALKFSQAYRVCPQNLAPPLTHPYTSFIGHRACHKLTPPTWLGDSRYHTIKSASILGLNKEPPLSPSVLSAVTFHFPWWWLFSVLQFSEHCSTSHSVNFLLLL